MRHGEVIAIGVRRRVFLTMAAAGVALLPGAGWTQQPKLRMVGVLVNGKPDPRPILESFREELGKRGYAEGRNVHIVVQSAEGGKSPRIRLHRC